MEKYRIKTADESQDHCLCVCKPDRTTLLRKLRPLQRDGLVRAKGGGRGGHVELEITAKGRKALPETVPAWRSAQDKVVATLGKERWSAIIDDLEEVATQSKAR